MGDHSPGDCSKRKLQTPRSVFHPKLGKFVDLDQMKTGSKSLPCKLSSTFDSKQKHRKRDESSVNRNNDSATPMTITLMESFISRNSSSKENEAAVNSASANWSVMKKSSFYKYVDCIEDMKHANVLKKTINSTITSQKLIEYGPEKACFKLSDTAPLNWKNPVLGDSQNSITSAATSKVLSRNNFDKIYSSFRFNKEMLKNAIVLGQVDDKFIACRFVHKECDVLVLIDQHAAHERIRLEKLLEQIGYYETDCSKTTLKQNICSLSPPVELVFTNNEIDILLHYSSEFHDVGIKYTMCKLKMGNAPMYRVLVSSVPSIFVNVCEAQVKAKGSSVNANLLKEYIAEQGQMMRSCTAKCSIASPVIFKVLASYACHGAIKFGDKLTKDIYIKLVADLAKCQLPFQCAHGRPAIAPLLQMSTLAPFLKQHHLKERKANIRKLASKMNAKSKGVLV